MRREEPAQVSTARHSTSPCTRCTGSPTVAERTGQIVPVGAWVLRQACLDLQRLRAARGHDLRVSVNLSARQLQLKTVAEGVETVEQQNFLLSHMCAEVQGFLYAERVAIEVLVSGAGYQVSGVSRPGEEPQTPDT